MLSPADIVAGAQIGAHPGAYVLGCFDTRITFYSQQVRALELAHALQHEHLLPAGARVAVIGGGVGGVTLAAALALQGGTMVRLFEKASSMLPLQSDSRRRRLDPHIYEWPKPDADHEFAELPLLDWRSGSAVEVRDAVLRELAEINASVDQRLVVQRRHEITSVEPRHGRFLLTFERDATRDGRETAREEVDLVLLSIGFGIEPRHAILGTDTPSYWRDAGVPGPDIEGKARLAFLVSGNGDGGLIDLLAAASRTFDHSTIIRGIAQRPGVQALRPSLLEIDALARDAERHGVGFDFLAAYDRELGNQIEALGLVDDMRAQLRPGVQLFLQTREQELLSIKTARLNRLAVYLITRACARGGAERFEHIACNDVRLIPRPPGTPSGPMRLDCGGRIIEVDQVIARRGPGKDTIRAPFINLLAGHEAEHEAWVQRFLEDSIAPDLHPATRAHFDRLARDARLPPPRYRLYEVQKAMPQRVKLSLIDQSARWSGDLAIDDAINAWGHDAAALELLVTAAPDVLGAPLAHAVARLAIHARRARLILDVARWRPFVELLSIGSPSAGGLPMPELHALGNNGSILNAVTDAPDVVATRLNRAMDRWILDAIGRHLERYLTYGDDPGRAVSVAAAAALRSQMAPIWHEWRAAFHADPELLRRFLGLAACARDDATLSLEASVLVGPHLTSPLIRACAVALVVATAWRVTAPRGTRPGNLARAGAGTARTGHICAAGYIEGEDMAIAALRHMWSTEFVLLPMQALPTSMLADTNASLARGSAGIPSLGEVDSMNKLMLTVDQRFHAAAQTGADALCELLIAIEESHFSRLMRAIESGANAGEQL